MKKPICLFDSGLGGLTVLKKLTNFFPNEDYVYLADEANVPFGDKTNNQIKERAKSIIKWLSKFNPKIIILACNTSSAILYQQLSDISTELGLPVFGMIESIAREIADSNFTKVSVWATKLAVENNGYKNAINKLNSKMQVEQIACPKLVRIIEDLSQSRENKKKVIQEYLDTTSKDIDALILGCTHYPLIEQEISELCKFKLIDPGDALIKEVSKYLGNNIHPSTNNKKYLQLYTTDQAEKLRTFASFYLMEKLEPKVVKIETQVESIA